VGKSSRTKTIPLSAGAGKIVNCTGLPECNPMPTQETGRFNVNCQPDIMKNQLS
jgi:hypothetical protein